MRRGKAITEDLGIKLENVQMADLGQAKKITVDKDNTTVIEQGQAQRDRRPCKRNSQPGREDDQRLRPREAAGTVGEAGRWSGCDQSWSRDRDRNEREEGARRKTPCTLPVRPWKKALSPAAVWP